VGRSFAEEIHDENNQVIMTHLLIPDGDAVDLNDDNKADYFEKIQHFKMYGSRQKQIDAFLRGFHELVPRDMINIFDAAEIERLINGASRIDIDDLRANTNYEGYSADNKQVEWLFETLKGFDEEMLGKFLQFITGSSNVPLGGFAKLVGADGLEKFKIIRTTDTSRLPQSSTCHN